MKKVVVFSANSSMLEAYHDVEADTHDWLHEHPGATILASHTNMSAKRGWTEFALTLIVELPEEEQAHD